MPQIYIYILLDFLGNGLIPAFIFYCVKELGEESLQYLVVTLQEGKLYSVMH